MAFKIADAYVAVGPKDDNFEIGLRQIVDEAAAKVKAQVGLGVKDDGPASLREDIDVAIDLVTARLDANIGLGLHNDAVEELDADVKAGVKLVEDQNKVKVKVDPKSAQEAGQQGGLLIGSALVAGAAFAPGLILAGVSGAITGAGALLAASNEDVRAEYKTLAYDVSREMQDAVSPFVPAMQAAMVNVDKAITAEKPQIKALFADAEPDLNAFAGGVTGLALHTIPGLTTAVNQSRGIVAGFTGELPVLGDGIGRMFAGLTTNAQSTETGIKDFVDVTSNLIGTLGHVLGSAGAAISTDFAAVEPALNGALTVIDKIASPATVGGLVGAFGAMKFDPAISKGLQSASNGLTSIAAKADGASGLLGKTAGAAESAAGGLGKMADVMGGPWGIALGAGVGLLGGLVSSLNQSFASVSDFTAAVAQDNGVVGSNTTSIIQNKLQKLDLASAQKDLGVSQATLIEYAAGEKDAQEKVNTAYTKKIAALQAAGHVSGQNTQATVQGNIAAKAEADQLHGVMANLDEMTRAVQQALKDQNDQNQAFLAATKSAGIFAGMVDTATTALQAQAQQSAITTVASLQLGDGQEQLGQRLSNILYNYQLTADAAQGYGTVMQALHGATSQLDDAQNTLAQDMLNAKTSFAQNKYSLDLSTQAGINNRQALSAASKAIIQMGIDQVNAGGTIDEANQTINEQVDAFVKSTGATGKQREAIEKYLTDITKIPPDITTNIHANTGPAVAQVSAFASFVSGEIADINNTPIVLNGGGSGKALHANADGGPVQAGDVSVVGERGPEIVVFGSAGRVIPNEAIRTVGGTSSHAAAASLGTTIHNLTIPITLNGIVDFTDPINMTAAARRLAVQISNMLVQVRNARTGAIY